MTGPQRPIPVKDDVEGHAISFGKADAETTEGDNDAEGHAISFGQADAETTEGDNDAEGHVFVQQPASEGHSTPSPL